jgi:hypothetical protein
MSLLMSPTCIDIIKSQLPCISKKNIPPSTRCTIYTYVLSISTFDIPGP